MVVGFTLLSGWAQALPIESTPILIIDGIDGGTSVDITAVDVTSGYDFGYLDSIGDFVTIVSDGAVVGTETFSGGDVVDFAIQSTSDSSIYSLGPDAGGNNYASLEFTGLIDASNSDNPVVSEDYYASVTINWDLDGDGYADLGFDVATASSGAGDGLLAMPVPEPTTLILMGSGLAGLWWMERRMRRKDHVKGITG